MYVSGRERERERPAGPPEVFCVIHPPEIVQDLFGVSILPFPSPSRHDQIQENNHHGFNSTPLTPKSTLRCIATLPAEF